MALPFEIFVGLRYLRAKRRNRTISLNTVVSIAGITLGVAALIGTVGIMTGFKEDIQAKILGTTAHIIVQDRMKDGMSEYDPVAKHAGFAHYPMRRAWDCDPRNRPATLSDCDRVGQESLDWTISRPQQAGQGEAATDR